jgi:hypothetical protein
MSRELQAVLDLTDQVHAAITRGEWQRARELETERRELLERLLACVREDIEPQVAATLARLHERGHQLLGEAQHHKRRLLREATIVKTGREAARAYAEGQHAS